MSIINLYNQWIEDYKDILNLVKDNPPAKKYVVLGNSKTHTRTDSGKLQSIKKLIPKRNDPCECGSGKKYKHCCLNKEFDND